MTPKKPAGKKSPSKLRKPSGVKFVSGGGGAPPQYQPIPAPLDHDPVREAYDYARNLWYAGELCDRLRPLLGKHKS